MDIYYLVLLCDRRTFFKVFYSENMKKLSIKLGQDLITQFVRKFTFRSTFDLKHNILLNSGSFKIVRHFPAPCFRTPALRADSSSAVHFCLGAPINKRTKPSTIISDGTLAWYPHDSGCKSHNFKNKQKSSKISIQFHDQIVRCFMKIMWYAKTIKINYKMRKTRSTGLHEIRVDPDIRNTPPPTLRKQENTCFNRTQWGITLNKSWA